MPRPWTVAKAQAALGEIASCLLVLHDHLPGIKAHLPLPADVDDRLEHRKPYDVATELLTAIECAAEEIESAARSLAAAAKVTDEDLARQFETARDG
jgi:hypothetical protein